MIVGRISLRGFRNVQVGEPGKDWRREDVQAKVQRSESQNVLISRLLAQLALTITRAQKRFIFHMFLYFLLIFGPCGGCASSQLDDSCKTQPGRLH